MTLADLWPWLVVACGAAATYLPRALGVLLSGRIDAAGKLFDWISCVAYAILAALVARMIVLPTGPLESTDLVVRLAAVAVGVAVFYATRQMLLLGCFAGIAALAAFDWLSAL